MKPRFAQTLFISLLNSNLIRDSTHRLSELQLSQQGNAIFSEGYNDKDSLEDDNLLGAISDAEALLACHAFLRRKKRLEWTAAAERRKRQEQAIDAADEGPLSGLRPFGFFWEDRSQLPHVGLSDDRSAYNEPGSVRKGNSEKGTMKNNNIISSVGDWTFVDEDGGDLEEPLSTWESMITADKANRFSLPIDEEDEEKYSIVDDVSAIDYLPSLSYTRRSLAAMRRWSDPAWKEKWWNSRWGNIKSGLQSVKQKLNTSRQRRTEMRLKKLNPDELLASPEMAALSLDEIAEAIRSYRLSKRKRSRSRRKFLDQRINAINRNYTASFDTDSHLPIPRDYFVQDDVSKMREIQRKRSERAKQIYRKRLENESSSGANGGKRRDKKYEFVFPDESLPAASTPNEALIRINASLDAYQFPSIHDVELALTPKRLVNRKDTFIRILKDCFGLRGKCIPAMIDESTGDENMDVALRFVTECPIDLLGAFVLKKLEETQNSYSQS